MAIKSQGTDLYVFDPKADTPEAIKVGCPTTISPGDSEIDQIDVTCLGSDSKKYLSGVEDPGEASFTIFFDTSEDAHKKLYDFKQDRKELEWAIGFSDGEDDPDLESKDWKLPDGRSWYTFKGNIKSFPFSFDMDSAVESEISVQRTDSGKLSLKDDS